MKKIVDFYKSLDALNEIIFWGIIIIIILIIIFTILLIIKSKKAKKENNNYELEESKEEYDNQIPISTNEIIPNETLEIKEEPTSVIPEEPVIQESLSSEIPYEPKEEKDELEFQDMPPIEEEKTFVAEEHVIEYDNNLFNIPGLKKNTSTEGEPEKIEEPKKNKEFVMPSKPYERNVLREMSLSQTSPIGLTIKNDDIPNSMSSSTTTEETYEEVTNNEVNNMPEESVEEDRPIYKVREEDDDEFDYVLPSLEETPEDNNESYDNNYDTYEPEEPTEEETEEMPVMESTSEENYSHEDLVGQVAEETDVVTPEMPIEPEEKLPVVEQEEPQYEEPIFEPVIQAKSTEEESEEMPTIEPVEPTIEEENYPHEDLIEQVDEEDDDDNDADEGNGGTPLEMPIEQTEELPVIEPVEPQYEEPTYEQEPVIPVEPIEETQEEKPIIEPTEELPVIEQEEPVVSEEPKYEEPIIESESVLYNEPIFEKMEPTEEKTEEPIIEQPEYPTLEETNDISTTLPTVELEESPKDNEVYLEEVSKKLAEAEVPDSVERTEYEKKQEEDAIISYKELMEKKDTLEPVDEEDAVISIEELIKRKENEDKLYNITEDEDTDDFINELKKFRDDLE